MTSFWWIFCVIITATYCANLVAFLTVDKYHPQFNTLNELSQQTEFKFGTQGGTAFRTYFEVRVLRRMFIIYEFFKVSISRQLVMPFLPPANVVCEGYVFTPVCHSVHRGGLHGCSQRGCAWLLGGDAWLLRGGMHGCSLGGHVWLLPGGTYMVAPGGHVWFFLGGGGEGGMHRIRRDTVNERAVRILLECILMNEYLYRLQQ